MRFHNDIFDRISTEKKERILEVATEEFSRNGFSGTNVNIIAEKLQLSVGSLYKYFETKENFFLTVVNHCVSMLENILDEVLNRPIGLFDKIEELLIIIQNHSRENPQLINLYNELTSEGNTRLAEKISHQLETISAESYKSLLIQAQKEGHIDNTSNASIFAFCLDNLFLTLQFSYASEYYKNRMKIYLGDYYNQDDLIISEIMKFIKKALS